MGQGWIQPRQRGTNSFCPVGTAGPAGRCHCWVPSQEQGLTKSFLLPGRKTCHEIAGKVEADCCGCICSSQTKEAKECVCLGRRVVRQEGKFIERCILVSLDSISVYFLGCNTTCRPQTRAGRCRAKRVLQPKGAAPSPELHGSLADGWGGLG